MGDFAALLAAFVGGVGGFFNIPFPGLEGVSFGTLFLSLALAVLGIRLVSYLYGLPGGGGISTRTKSTKNAKISEERRGDEY